MDAEDRFREVGSGLEKKSFAAAMEGHRQSEPLKIETNFKSPPQAWSEKSAKSSGSLGFRPGNSVNV